MSQLESQRCSLNLDSLLFFKGAVCIKGGGVCFVMCVCVWICGGGVFFVMCVCVCRALRLGRGWSNDRCYGRNCKNEDNCMNHVNKEFYCCDQRKSNKSNKNVSTSLKKVETWVNGFYTQSRSPQISPDLDTYVIRSSNSIDIYRCAAGTQLLGVWPGNNHPDGFFWRKGRVPFLPEIFWFFLKSQVPLRTEIISQKFPILSIESEVLTDSWAGWGIKDLYYCGYHSSWCCALALIF
jgi:hypothetical protein